MRAMRVADSGTVPPATMIKPANAAGSATLGVAVGVGGMGDGVGVGTGRLGKVRS